MGEMARNSQELLHVYTYLSPHDLKFSQKIHQFTTWISKKDHVTTSWIKSPEPSSIPRYRATHPTSPRQLLPYLPYLVAKQHLAP